MNALDFIVYARKNNLTAEKVRQHLPGLPIHVCQGLLDGTAFVERVNPNGSLVIDDGQP